MESNFEYNNLPVRTITDEENQLWFAAIDVCNVLEYSNPNQAVEKLDDDEKAGICFSDVRSKKKELDYK